MEQLFLKHDKDHIVSMASGMLSSLVLLLSSSEGENVSKHVLAQALEGVDVLLEQATQKD